MSKRKVSVEDCPEIKNYRTCIPPYFRIISTSQAPSPNTPSRAALYSATASFFTKAWIVPGKAAAVYTADAVAAREWRR